MCKMLKPTYCENYYIDYNQILYNETTMTTKYTSCHSCGWSIYLCNKSKNQKNHDVSAMIWQIFTKFPTMGLLTVPAVEILEFSKLKMAETAASLKNPIWCDIPQTFGQFCPLLLHSVSQKISHA